MFWRINSECKWLFCVQPILFWVYFLVKINIFCYLNSRFLLVFALCGCTAKKFKKLLRNILAISKNNLSLHQLSWKQSFYLKKLIPIEDMKRLSVKTIALFFYYSVSTMLRQVTLCLVEALKKPSNKMIMHIMCVHVK